MICGLAIVLGQYIPHFYHPSLIEKYVSFGDLDQLNVTIVVIFH